MALPSHLLAGSPPHIRVSSLVLNPSSPQSPSGSLSSLVTAPARRGRPKRWTMTRPDHGLSRVSLSAWKYFSDLITKFLPVFYSNTIWRGQSDATWPLQSSLDRELLKRGRLGDVRARGLHLHQFKLAARGRRGRNPTGLSSDNDWWALGQHYGLFTPLLDWTGSPYVALYFAFLDQKCNSGTRAVWALNRISMELLTSGNAPSTMAARSPVEPFEFVVPFSDENVRLASQGGLFTRAPDGLTIDDWIHRNLQKKAPPMLLRIDIPDSDREDCLRSLNRMNINHLSLFPDLDGAAKHTNTALLVDRY
jgi:FRG domain